MTQNELVHIRNKRQWLRLIIVIFVNCGILYIIPHKQFYLCLTLDADLKLLLFKGLTNN